MIKIQGVTKHFEDKIAVNDLTLDIKEGELFVLLGESGSGKSTLMRMINNLISFDSGDIIVKGRSIKEVDPLDLRRSIGYVVQNSGLFPNMTVAENIAVVPNLLKWDKAKITDRVNEMLNIVRLDPSMYAHKRVNELSGGQAQRVGVARALAADQDIILMDEPFGALDPITRDEIQTEFIKIQKELNKTVVFVTHDVTEAMKLADRMAIMVQGELIIVGTPREIINSTDKFVRKFLGSDLVITVLSKYPVAQFANETILENCSNVLDDSLSMKEALSQMLQYNYRAVNIRNSEGAIIGSISLDTFLNFFTGSSVL